MHKKSKLYISYITTIFDLLVQQKMNKAILAILFAFLLTESFGCDAGWYQPATGKCTQCTGYPKVVECADNTGAATKWNSKLKGYQESPTGTFTAYCTTNMYNQKDNVCEIMCKDGCKDCLVDYDFCTNCHGGYVWNPEYTCLPAIIGLEAASLALLVLALVFLIIGCCYVNKARK